MDEKAQELYSFIQERYLWQFYSRTWDRDENINNILDYLVMILAGEKLASTDSKERYYYAEAVTVANEVKKRFPWLAEVKRAELEQIVADVKTKLIDVVITRSQNEELHVPYY